MCRTISFRATPNGAGHAGFARNDRMIRVFDSPLGSGQLWERFYAVDGVFLVQGAEITMGTLWRHPHEGKN